MILWDDNTRIKWAQIKDNYLPDNSSQTIETRCKNNDLLTVEGANSLLENFGIVSENNGSLLFKFSYDESLNIGRLYWFNKETSLYTETIRVSEGFYDRTDTRWDRTYIRIPVEISSYTGNKLVIKKLTCDVTYPTNDGLSASISGNINNMYWVLTNQSVGKWYNGEWISNLRTINTDNFPLGSIDFMIECPNLASGAIQDQKANYVSLSYDCEYYQVERGILTISDTSDAIRFRQRESDKTGEVIWSPGSQIIDYGNLESSSVWLGDIIRGQIDEYLYNWNNYDWNPKQNLIFSLVEGNQNTSPKTESITSISDETLDDNSKLLIKRQSKLQTIPKLLINNKYLMKIRTINSNKVAKDNDGYIINNLKINNVEKNYRFGASPDSYPVYIKNFTGADSIDVTLNTHDEIISITGHPDIKYNPYKDILVVYRHKAKSYTVDNSWQPTFSKKGSIMVFNSENGSEWNDGLNLSLLNSSYLRDRTNSTDVNIQLNIEYGVAEIDENIKFQNDEIKTKTGLNWTFKDKKDNELYKSITVLEKKSNKIQLKNVGYQSNSSTLSINIGPKTSNQAARLSRGITANIQYDYQKLIIDKPFEFDNRIRTTGPIYNWMKDTYVSSSIDDEISRASDVEAFCNSNYNPGGSIYHPHAYIKLVGTPSSGIFSTKSFVSFITDDLSYLTNYSGWESIDSSNQSYKLGDFRVNKIKKNSDNTIVENSDAADFIGVYDVHDNTSVTYHLKVGLDMSNCYSTLYELVLWKNAK